MLLGYSTPVTTTETFNGRRNSRLRHTIVAMLAMGILSTVNMLINLGLGTKNRLDSLS